MTCTIVIIEIQLPWVKGLKGRRAILNSIKEKLGVFNLSLLDISGEYLKEAGLALSFLSSDETQAQRSFTKIDDFLYKHFPEISFDISFEML